MTSQLMESQNRIINCLFSPRSTGKWIYFNMNGERSVLVMNKTTIWNFSVDDVEISTDIFQTYDDYEFVDSTNNTTADLFIQALTIVDEWSHVHDGTRIVLEEEWELFSEEFQNLIFEKAPEPEKIERKLRLRVETK